MSKQTLVKMLFVLLIGAMVLSACAPAATQAPAAATQAPAAATQAPAAATTAPVGKFLLAIVSISPAEANNARFIDGAKKAGGDRGWEIQVIDAHGSADEANAAITNMVTRGANAIVDMVFPTTSLGGGLKAAQDANIPVGTWGGGMGTAVVVTNGSGGPHAIPIVNQMIENMKGEGEVLALTYHTGQVCREREENMDTLLKAYPKIKVTKNEVRIPGYLQDGADYTSAWLASHAKGSGNLAIWGCWDDPALGAISTLKQQDRKDVLVYGENGNADAIKAIRDGWMTATAWQNSYQEGIVMVETFEKAIAAGKSWTPIAAEVPAVVIDKTTVEQFIKDHPESITN